MRKYFFSTAVSVQGASLFAASANAVTITVPNGSFEMPATGGGPNSTNNYSPNNPNIPDWVFVDNGGDVGGIQDQGPNGANNTGNPIGTDGFEWAFVNLSNGAGGGPFGSITSAATVTTIQPNTTYTLTIAVGNNTQIGGYDHVG